MNKTENDVFALFLEMIENKWREKHGIPERIKVTVADEETPPEDDERTA